MEPLRLCDTCKHLVKPEIDYPCVICLSTDGENMWEPRDSKGAATDGR